MLMRESPPIDVSGTEVKIDGIDDLIMKEGDIMGVFTKAEAKTEID